MNPVRLEYPDLPVARERSQIIDAIRANQVVVVVGDTGSGKTTQLPKMALEYARDAKIEGKLLGCTQPRRIAAASVAKRVAEEMNTRLGEVVGYQVRFQEKVSKQTTLKFMTDGILLAETQGDKLLQKYHTLIIDEAHERSLNIDFLLGYLKRLLPKRPDLKILISSATLDAGGFADFFDNCPIIEVEGRAFPVELEYLPAENNGKEDLARHVNRAVEWISQYDTQGDILVFLPGERAIRDCTDMLEGKKYRATDICPLFARLGLGDQQRIFNPTAGRRRIVLATNVAETSLTIPGIIYVVDSGVARVSRWNPGRQVQRLQIEPVSKASARQRKGRCGRVTEGICIRLYDEEDFDARPEFTDPEIRRSSLAGVILRMKSLGLPEIAEFPFIDPPKTGNITEGYRTLREIGALNKDKELTAAGRQLARIPVEPRLGKMLLAASETNCLGAMLIIVSGLTVMDPRERPADKQELADKAHEQWRDEDSDFLSYLHLWTDIEEYRERGKWKRNQLRKFCKKNFVNYRRILEWDNLRRELGQLGRKQLKWNWRDFDGHGIDNAEYQTLHEALISGIPKSFGLFDPEKKDYKSASGGRFAIFPGSGLFGQKKPEWLLAFEMVDTTRLWARRVARIDPAWIENVAPHLCRSRFHSAYWNKQQGAVYAKEVVVCGGINIVEDRRIHYGRIDPAASREIFIRDGLLGDGLIKQPKFLKRIQKIRKEVEAMEQKLRRSGGLWHDDAIFQFIDQRLPANIHTAKAFHRWMRSEAESNSLLLPTVVDIIGLDPAELKLEDYPDELKHDEESYALHYQHTPGEPLDGMTIEVALSQLHNFPEWLPTWGVTGELEGRVTILIRSLPKVIRVACQPIQETASDFVAEWEGWHPQQSLYQALAEYLAGKTGKEVSSDDFELTKLPEAMVAKIWVYDDESGEEVKLGTDVAELKELLHEEVEEHFDQNFGSEWEMTGQTDWQSIPDLPKQIEAGGRIAYPALTDEGACVGVKLYLDAESALLSHSAGLGRLFLSMYPDQRKYLEKNLPMDLETRMMLPLFGEQGVSNEAFCLLAAIGVFHPSYPRTKTEFNELAEVGRGDFHSTASQLGKWLDQAVVSFCEISKFLEDNRGEESLHETVEDIDLQIAWLLREDFLLQGGWQRAKDLPRYFRAIEERISRLNSQPLLRDLEKMDRIHPFITEWETEAVAHADSIPIQNLGYAIEELRVSLFAPSVPTGMKISEQRLEKLFAKLF